MDDQEAYNVFDLDESASQEDIKDRFKELIIQVHPDQGGSSEEFSDIIEAKEHLTGSNTELVFQPTSIDKPETYDPEYEQKQNQTEKTVNKIIRNRTSTYRRYKQVTKVIGGVGGFMLFIRALSGLTGYEAFTRGLFLYFPVKIKIMQELVSIILIPVVIVFGLQYWYLSIKINNIEVMITEIEESFDQKSNIIRILEEIQINEKNKSVSEQDLKEEIYQWMYEDKEVTNIRERLLSTFKILSIDFNLKKIAAKIGSSDFTRIFLRKAIEHNIIEEKVKSKNSKIVVEYRINLPD